MFGKKTHGKSESGVSEIIGSVLLISVVVIGVAIIGVVLMSHSTPEKIPVLSAVISEDTTQRIISLYNDGGDALSNQTVTIRLDGVDKTTQFTKSGYPWQTWAIGESLKYTVPASDQMPRIVQIVYSTGSSATILASADFSTGLPTAGPISTTTPVPVTSHNIIASAGSGGSISPSGTVSVTNGTSQTFSITANSGYHIAGVLIDGVSIGTVSTYTFSNVVADHTIVASFATTAYVINASATTGGTISPSGSVSVTYGGNQTFTITPNSGYYIPNVIVDGTSQGAITSYTFTNVTAAHTIAASFAINTYTITASAGTGGSISPSGSVSVTYGGNQTFTIAPNSGYAISGVTVDGTSQGSISTYTFTNVVATHTINATFVVMPVVTSISPTTGPKGGGTLVTITGTGFTSAATVKFGANAATSVTFVSSTQITAKSPALSTGGTVDVTVTTVDGTSATSANDQFTYTGVVPTVTGISPTTGPAAGGTSVTITGTGFTSAATVMFGANAGTSVTFVSSTQLTANAPSFTNGGTVDVTVTTTGGTSATSSADQFTYSDVIPTVTSISPTHGPNGGGNKITITGTGFTSAATVMFGANAGTSVTFVSSTQLTANAPAYASYVTVDVTVITTGGTSATSSADQYSYDGVNPTVTSISPTTGPAAGGTSVTITGTGFTSAATVKFGGNAATSVTYVSPTQIIAVSPAGTNTVDITVTNIDGTSAKVATDKFTYT